MTFAAPAVLLGLLALPLLAVVYVRRQRAGGPAAAFATSTMLASVQPRRPRWRRHVAALVAGLALAALIVAAARPQKSVAVTVDKASIILATDVSGSMLATDVKPSRLEAAKSAARAFVDKVPAKVNIGVLAYNQSPNLLQSPTTDRAAVDQAISSLRVSGATASGDAVLAALRTLAKGRTAAGKRAPGAIVLLSDGASTRGADPVAAAREAKRQGVPIYTIALGTAGGTITVKSASGATQVKPVPPDPTTLSAMASASGGKTFTVAGVSELKQVYQRLGSQLGRVKRLEEMTAYAVAAGLVLLLSGAALSLRWFGRLI